MTDKENSGKEEAKAPKKPKTERINKVAARLTTSQRAEAIALWEAGDITYAGLEEKFGKSKAAFQQLFDKLGVKYASKRAETTARVKESVQATLMGEASIIAQRIKDTKEQHYIMAEGIARITSNILRQCAAEKIPIGSRINDMKALQNAANIMRITREDRYAILGLNDIKEDDDVPLPDLVVRELTVEQVKLMHNQKASNVGNEDFDMGQGMDFTGDDIDV